MSRVQNGRYAPANSLLSLQTFLLVVKLTNFIGPIQKNVPLETFGIVSNFRKRYFPNDAGSGLHSEAPLVRLWSAR